MARSDNGTPTVETIRAMIRAELPVLPRFRQRPMARSRWHRWRWVDVDPDAMDWDWHVCERVAPTPGVGDDIDTAAAVLSRAVAEIAVEPMPRDRPMWRSVLIREITPGRSGLLFLVHHCVADGVGTVIHALNLLSPRIELPAGDAAAIGRMRRLAAVGVGLARLATDGTPAARLGSGSAERQFAAAAFDLAELRSLARRHGARVIDVVLCLLAIALVRTHHEFCAAVDHQLRISVPMVVRDPGSGDDGNVTAAAMIDVPLHEMDAATRLAQINASSARMLTAERALASRFVMTSALGALPAPVQRMFARAVYGPAFLQAVVTNMPGPAPAMSIAGVPVERVVPILPLAPDTTFALGALSWTGVLGLGLAADPAFVDADALASAMRDAMRELAGAHAHDGDLGPAGTAA